jgi:hypothetical protein
MSLRKSYCNCSPQLRCSEQLRPIFIRSRVLQPILIGFSFELEIYFKALLRSFLPLLKVVNFKFKQNFEQINKRRPALILI